MVILKALLTVILLLLAGSAVAQDLNLPPVPTVGISPILQWVMGVSSALLTAVFSIILLLLKQRFDVSNTLDHNTMIDRAVKRGALVSYGNQMSGVPPEQAVADGVAYVKNGVPDAIGKTNQATDTHLANAIQAEVVALNQTGTPIAPPPLTPPIALVRP